MVLVYHNSKENGEVEGRRDIEDRRRGGCRIEKEGETGSEKEDECSTTVKLLFGANKVKMH